MKEKLWGISAENNRSGHAKSLIGFPHNQIKIDIKLLYYKPPTSHPEVKRYIRSWSADFSQPHKVFYNCGSP